MRAAGPNHRPRRRVWFPETPDPDVEIAAALASFQFDVRLRYGEHISVDLADLGRRALLRPFVLTLWRICQIGGPAGALSTAKAYVNAVRRFWAYLDDRHPAIRRPKDLAPEHVNGFETWLRAGRHSEITAYQIMAKLTGCLRVIHEEQPGSISASLFARLHHVSSRYCGKSRPRDAVQRTGHRIIAGGLAARGACYSPANCRHRRSRSAEWADGERRKMRAAYRVVMEHLRSDGAISCALPIYRELYWLRRVAGARQQHASRRATRPFLPLLL